MGADRNRGGVGVYAARTGAMSRDWAYFSMLNMLCNTIHIYIISPELLVLHFLMMILVLHTFKQISYIFHFIIQSSHHVRFFTL